MTKEQKEFYKDLEGMHAVVTKCWSDLHAFSCGSSYDHELRFENGVESPIKPLKYCPHTFEPPLWRVRTYMIIGVSEDEKKYYKKEFENRTPNQKLWWYVTPNSWLNDK